MVTVWGHIAVQPGIWATKYRFQSLLMGDYFHFHFHWVSEQSMAGVFSSHSPCPDIAHFLVSACSVCADWSRCGHARLPPLTWPPPPAPALLLSDDGDDITSWSVSPVSAEAMPGSAPPTRPRPRHGHVMLSVSGLLLAHVTWILASYWSSHAHHNPLIGQHPTFCSASNSEDNLDGMVAGSTLTTLPCRFNMITRYVGAAQRSPHQTPGPDHVSRLPLLMWLATNITADHVTMIGLQRPAQLRH